MPDCILRTSRSCFSKAFIGSPILTTCAAARCAGAGRCRACRRGGALWGRVAMSYSCTQQTNKQYCRALELYKYKSQLKIGAGHGGVGGSSRAAPSARATLSPLRLVGRRLLHTSLVVRGGGDSVIWWRRRRRSHANHSGSPGRRWVGGWQRTIHGG